MLRAIDISSWQAGIDVRSVDADIVIVKATGGTSYTNGYPNEPGDYWREWADAALESGKLLAFYHFANDIGWNTAQAEARHFLDTVKDYKGRFVPILDWEGMALNNDVAWAREWLDIVAEETGSTPFFYAYASYVAWKDLSSVARYPLWMASYVYDGTGWVDDPRNVWGTGNWDRMAMYQYTSTGYIAGYGGRLDLSVFYGTRDDWLRLEGNMATNADLVDLLMPVSTNYVFGGTRYDIHNTDCSGILCGACYITFGLDPYELGDCTGRQWNGGTLTKLWWGTTPDFPWDTMKKGDFIFTSNCSPDFSTGQGSHVGLYTGDPTHPFLSHFCNGGPYVTAVNGVYGGTECYFGLARYEKGSDDMRPAEVWEYNYQGSAVAGNMYNALNFTAQAVVEGHDSAAGDGSYGSMKDRVDWIDMRVREMHEATVGGQAGPVAIDYDELAKALAANINYDKLANIFADMIAKRMAD